jgi:AcrR family transcriptional regulator
VAHAATPLKEDRRRARTRAALLQAGQTLFAEHTVESVSVDDIVLCADVAKGSFYNHFADKEELARLIAENVRCEAERLVGEANHRIADPALRVAQALCIFVRFARACPEKARALMRLHAGATLPEAPLNSGVRADLQRGIAEGRFRDLSLQAGLLLIMGVVQIAIGRVLEPKSPVPSMGLARDLAFLLLRGLGLASREAAAIASSASERILGTADETIGRRS